MNAGDSKKKEQMASTTRYLLNINRRWIGASTVETS